MPSYKPRCPVGTTPSLTNWSIWHFGPCTSHEPANTVLLKSIQHVAQKCIIISNFTCTTQFPSNLAQDKHFLSDRSTLQGKRNLPRGWQCFCFQNQGSCNCNRRNCSAQVWELLWNCFQNLTSDLRDSHCFLRKAKKRKIHFLNLYPLTPLNAGNNSQCSEDNKVEKNCSQDTQQQAVESARLHNDNFERNQSKN